MRRKIVPGVCFVGVGRLHDDRECAAVGARRAWMDMTSSESRSRGARC